MNTYYVYEEASESLEMTTENLQEAIDYTKSKRGKHYVTTHDGEILYDSQPGVTYKI